MRALLCALVLSALLAPSSALAQVPAAQPQVGLSLSAAALRVDAGNESVVLANVTNQGSLPATVTLSFAPLAGWTVTPDVASPFALAANGAQTVRLTVRAPAAGAGAAEGPLGVTATLTESTTGRQAPPAKATLALSRVDPAAAAPPSLWPPERVAAAALGSVAVVAGVVALERRRRVRAEALWRERETGLALEPDGPTMPWGARREMLQRVAVRNVGSRPLVALVGVRAASPGWTAALSLPRLPLAPGERAVVTLYLNPAPDVPGGAPGEVTLYARTAEAQEHEEVARVALEAPPVRVPAAAGGR